MHAFKHLHQNILLLLCVTAGPLGLVADTGVSTQTTQAPGQKPADHRLSLEQALAEALSRSPSLSAAEAEVEAARGEAESALLRPPSELSFTPGWKRTREGDGTQHEFKGSLSLSRPLQPAGRRTLLQAAAERNIELRQMAVEGLRFQLQASVRRHFAGLLGALQAVAIRTEQERAAKLFQEAAVDRVRKGFSAELEALKARTEWIAAQRQLREAESVAEEERLELNTLLGRESSSPLLPLGSPLPRPEIPSLAELSAMALAVNPAFRVLALQSDLADIRSRSARLARKSELSVGPSIEYSRSEQVLGFSVTMSLPDRRSGRGELRAASAEQRRILAEREQLKREITASLARTVSRHEALAAQLALYDAAHLEDLRSAMNQAETAYGGNASSLLLLLETRRNYFDTLAERQTLLGELLAVQADLEAALGAPLPGTVHTSTQP